MRCLQFVVYSIVCFANVCIGYKPVVDAVVQKNNVLRNFFLSRQALHETFSNLQLLQLSKNPAYVCVTCRYTKAFVTSDE